MSTTTIKQNIIYGLGEGDSVGEAMMLTYSLRWANAAYREVFNRYQFKSLRKRSVFRTADGQSTYQMPPDMVGFLTIKDDSNDVIIDQVTTEEFNATVATNQITNESFTSVFDTAVSLDYQGIAQYSETVTNITGTTTYVRDSDYSMDYVSGKITVSSTGSMVTATAYYIDYLYYSFGKPTQYCLEYDTTNKKFVLRFNVVPDATYVASLLYVATPSDLSSTVEPIWSKFEFMLERGGIYYGSMELIDDAQKRAELKQNYENAIQALIQADMSMIPKHMTIPIKMRKTEYYNA